VFGSNIPKLPVNQYPKIIEIAFFPLSLKFSRSKKPSGSTAQKDKFTYSFSLHRKKLKTGLFLTTQKGMNCCLFEVNKLLHDEFF
jgi:hypothetical protein